MGQVIIPTSATPNPKANESVPDRIVAFTSQSSGGFRTIQLADTVLKFINQIKIDSGKQPVLPEFSSKLSTTKNVLVIPYLPFVTKSAIKALQDLKSKDGQLPDNFPKKVAVAVRNTTEAIGMHGYFWPLVFPWLRETVLPIASTFDLINDTTDVGIRAADVVRSCKLEKAAEKSAFETIPEKRATEEVKQSISDTKTFSIIRLVKAVSGAVSGILGLTLLATGILIVPAIALLALSLISVVSAISSEFYRDSRKFSLVEL